MSDRAKALADAIDANTDEVAAFFSALNGDQLSQTLYADGAQWTVKDMLGHFVTIEPTQLWLFKNIAEGGEGSPEDFDLDRFNRGQPKKVADQPVGDLLERFKANRIEMVAFIRSLSDSALDNEGRHAFLGMGNLHRFIKVVPSHTREHMQHIRDLLGLN